MKQSHYLIVAGASGGHIIPALNHARSYQHDHPGTMITFITSQEPLDLHIMHEHAPHTADFKHVALPLPPIARQQWYHMPSFLLQSIRTFITTTQLLYRTKQTAVYTTGSYIAVPVSIIARLFRIPIILHELNVEPGRTMQFLARTASRIYICFEKTAAYFPTHNCILMPYPLNAALLESRIAPQDLYRMLGFDPTRTTICIVGGSQGSVSLNTIIKHMITEYPDAMKNIQFIHQTGSYDTTDWPAWYRTHSITAHAFSYDTNLSSYYGIADIIITRAGSGVLHEIMHLQKRTLIIPLITNTTQHQYANARAMQEKYPHLVSILDEKIISQDRAPLLRICLELKAA